RGPQVVALLLREGFGRERAGERQGRAEADGVLRDRLRAEGKGRGGDRGRQGELGQGAGAPAGEQAGKFHRVCSVVGSVVGPATRGRSEGFPRSLSAGGIPGNQPNSTPAS